MMATVLSGGGGAALLPFSDDFARADGDLGNSWEYTTGKWTIASGAAVGTPGLGSTLNANPGFDTDTSWTKQSGWSISGGKGVKAPIAGTNDIYQNGLVSVGPWYRVDWTISTFTAGQFFARIGNSLSLARGATGTYIDIGRAASANVTGVAGGATADGTIDNYTVKLVTLADTFATRDLGSASIDLAAPVTLVSRTAAGVVACLDSKTSPANFILAYHNGTNAVLDKCVGGTYTNLISAAATYAAGRIVRLVKNGNTVQLYYNNVQIGTDQTVSDAGITSNTRHGVFSVAPENSIGEFSAANP